MKNIRQLIFAILCIFFLLIAVSPKSYAQNQLLQKGEITNKNFIDTLPFEFVKNKIIIPVFLNGKVRRFILDTAAPLLITKELQAECQFELLQKDVIADISQRLDSTYYVQISSIKLGNIEIKQAVGMMADLNAGLLACFGIEGIIGSNLLKDMILHIDYSRKEIILTSQIEKLNLLPENAIDMPLDARQSTPIIEIIPFSKAKEQVFIDTGDDGFYSMSLRSFQFFMEKTKLKNYLLTHAKGASTSGLHGLEQDTTKHLLRFDSLKISNLYFSNVNVMTQTNPNSRIGAEILKYGKLTIDYLHKKFYFQSFENTHFIRFQPESSSNLGFSLKNEGNLLKVGAVFENSDAFQKGIKAGFIIEKIDDYEVKNKTVCELLLDLSTLFDGKEKVNFVFLNLEGKKENITIRLR
jgi:Aspartyl protease